MNNPAAVYFTSQSVTRPNNTTAYTALDVIGADAGTAQVETATAVGTITAAVAQVETATVVGVITLAGNATVVVTSAAMENSPKTFSVPVLLNDAQNAIALAIRTALAADENVTDAFTVSGATDKVVLTRLAGAANDATLNISVDNGTCTGITTAASSANTTAGVASGAGNATVVVTGAALASSPVTVSVAVAAGDTAATWAGKVRTALGLLSSITTYYTVSGAGDSIILTAVTPAANDATLNISLDNGTCTGITTAASSANTTAGSITTGNAGSAILSFSNIGPASGNIKITDVSMRVDVAAVWAGSGAFRLHLYNASPTAILDNAGFDMVSGDRAKYLGFVDLAAPVDMGSTIYSQNKEVNKTVKLAGSGTIYAQLQTIAGYTPAASEVYTIEIGSVAA